MKAIIWWSVLVLAGVIGVIGFLRGPQPVDVVKCGDTTMSPGDRCEETQLGNSTTKSYDEVKSDQESEAVSGPKVSGIFGAVTIPIGLAGIVVTLVRRKRKAAEPAQQGFPQQPQHYGPPQGTPPQGFAPQGTPPQGFAPQGTPPQGYAPQGTPPQGFPPQGFAPQGTPPQGYQQPGYPPQQNYGPPPGHQQPPQGFGPQGGH